LLLAVAYRAARLIVVARSVVVAAARSLPPAGPATSATTAAGLAAASRSTPSGTIAAALVAASCATCAAAGPAKQRRSFGVQRMIDRQTEGQHSDERDYHNKGQEQRVFRKILPAVVVMNVPEPLSHVHLRVHVHLTWFVSCGDVQSTNRETPMYAARGSVVKIRVTVEH
jgi:hypothetical protein